MHSVRVMEDLAKYLPHYLQARGILYMFVTAAAAVLICVGILAAFGRRHVSPDPDGGLSLRLENARRYYNERSLIERYVELMVSGTIFLLFTACYFMITYFGVAGKLWDKYSSYILLLLIIVAVFVNAWLDKILIPLETLRPGERESIHLIAILYMLVIFAYIKFVYENDNYDAIIQYFILLLIGRFVGFDTSLGGIRKTLSMAARNLPLLSMALLSTGLMALVGFGSGYLIVQNGVVWNLFLGQLFLVIVMSVVYQICKHSWRKAEEADREQEKQIYEDEEV